MIAQETIKAARARLEENLTLEFIVGSTLSADCRRALLRQELSTLDDAAAEDLLERVLGRLGYDDPLVALMATQQIASTHAGSQRH